MFLLPDGRSIALDVAFNIGDTYFPANWLRLSSPQDRVDVGITEVPDPPSYDQRFYWGYTASGTLIPKDHTGLVETWTSQTRQTANTLLSPSDWVIIREYDNGTVPSSGVKEWRQSIRLSCESKVVQIKETTTTDELASYITGSGYPYWPPQTVPPSIVVTEASGSVGTSDSVIFTSGFSSSQITFG